MRGISIVILLLVVAAGILLGVAWWSGLGGAGRAATADARGAGAGPRALAELDPAAVPAEPERAASPGAEREAVATPEPELPPEIGAFLDEPVPDGERVVGRVVDTAGLPIADARVLAARATGWSALPLDSRGMESGMQSRLEATTGLDGRFEIEGLEAGAARLAVRAAGFAPLDVEQLTVPRGEPYDVGDLTLSRGLVLAGRVIDALGAAVPGATIIRWSENDWGRAYFGSSEHLGAVLATTDENGRFRIDVLPPGPWSLLVESEEHPTKVFEGESDAADLVQDGLVLQLDPGLSIRGRVEAVDGSRVAGLTVRGTDVSGTLEGEHNKPRLYEETEVREDGSFELVGLNDAIYHLRAHRGDDDAWRRSWVGEAVQVRAGTDGVVLLVGSPSPIVFRLVDADDGSCVEDCEVTLSQHTRSVGMSMGVPDALVRRQPEGCRYEIDSSVLRSDLERLDVRIESPGYVTWKREEVDLVEGEPVDLGTIALEPAPGVRLHVVDGATGRPVAGAQVHLSAETSRGDADGETRSDSYEASDDTDASGIAIVHGLPGVVHRAWAEAEGYAPSSPVDVVPSREKRELVEIVLGPGGDVTARVVDRRGDPVAGIDVRRRRIGSDGEDGQVTDASGTAVFEDLQAGTHEFWLSRAISGDFIVLDGEDSEDTGSVLVDVAEGSSRTIELVAPPTCELAGTVREAGVPLAGARVWLEEQHPSTTRFSLSGRKEFEGRTDGRGRYRVERVRAGDWYVWVEHPNRAMDTRLAVHLEAARERLDVDLGVSIVEGRVIDEDGAPVAGARVSLESLADDGPQNTVQFSIMGDADDLPVVFDTSPTVQESITDDQGRFRFRGARPDVDLVAAVHGAWIESARSEPFQVPSNGVRSGVDVPTRRAGSVRVRLAGPGAKPGIWWQLSLEYQGDGEPQERSHGSGLSSLEHLFEGVAPGPWNASLEAPGDDEGEPQVRPVVVNAGEESVVEFQVP